MSKDVFRNRGVRVVVDTTQAAEFDIAGIQIADSVMERIARSLRALPHSPRDQIVGDVRLRVLEGFDVIFFLTREPDVVVINIGGVMIHEDESETAALLKKLEKIVMLRDVLGI